MKPSVRLFVSPKAAPRATVVNLMQATHRSHCGCPICAANQHSALDVMNAANAIKSGGRSRAQQAQRGYATPVDMPQKEYAFEVAASNLRFGEGVTRVRPHSHPGELLWLIGGV